MTNGSGILQANEVEKRNGEKHFPLFCFFSFLFSCWLRPYNRITEFEMALDKGVIFLK